MTATELDRESQSRREIADLLYKAGRQMNEAVTAAVQAIMSDGEIRPAVHLMTTAIDLSLREMKKGIER